MSAYQVYRVCCEGCGMEGPVHKKKAEAARLWDELPRPRESLIAACRKRVDYYQAQNANLTNRLDEIRKLTTE